MPDQEHKNSTRTLDDILDPEKKSNSKQNTLELFLLYSII